MKELRIGHFSVFFFVDGSSIICFFPVLVNKLCIRVSLTKFGIYITNMTANMSIVYRLQKNNIHEIIHIFLHHHKQNWTKKKEEWILIIKFETRKRNPIWQCAAHVRSLGTFQRTGDDSKRMHKIKMKYFVWFRLLQCHLIFICTQTATAKRES